MVTLETIFEKEVGDLSKQEKSYLVEHASQLNNEQKEKYKSVLETADEEEKDEEEKDKNENANEGKNNEPNEANALAEVDASLVLLLDTIQDIKGHLNVIKKSL